MHDVTVHKQQAVHAAGGQRWEVYSSPVKYAIPIPTRTILPLSFPLVAKNYSHSHGNHIGIPWEWEWDILRCSLPSVQCAIKP